MTLKNIFNQVTSTVATAVVLSAAIALQAPEAKAATFKWDFSNLIGGVDGTVSGTLEVEEGNDVSATSVILTSTTNPIFDSLVGFDFTTLPNFANQFNVEGKKITAARFATDFFSNITNLNMELNSGVFGDPDSQNQGTLTIAGNPFDVCTEDCLQTAELFGDNTGETQFAPTFKAVPEASPATGLLVTFGLVGVYQLRKTIRRFH
ncbi:hypothetical protein ACL6C3_29885 [Capilliphycus salinus ALCB114379]|uniref:hypothetical protein n=1 Tax=Capilliphycus salinus TaxID=2768948 RepID=UPI0039A5B8E6